MNWFKYRIDHAKDNLPRTMRFRTKADEEEGHRNNKIDLKLPLINKKEQNRERILGNSSQM